MPKRRRDDEETTRPLTLPEADIKPERLSDKRLLDLALKATPDPIDSSRHIPATRFAETVAFCSDRTMRRYQAGDRALPPLLREKCIEIVTDAAKKAARKAARA